MMILGAQSITSLKADLHQVINGGFAFSRLLNGKLTHKRRFVFVTLLIWDKVPTTNVLTEQFLQGNVPLRHLLKEETLFMSSWRSATKEVNDWSL